jgi:hypothetical protein
VSRCIREAVEHHVASRKSDRDFEEQIRGRIKKRQEKDRQLSTASLGIRPLLGALF